MFTGLIEEVGEVKKTVRTQTGIKVQISAAKSLTGTKPGDSINVDGVCLTAVEIFTDFFIFDIVSETMLRTTLGKLRVKDRVNLERALKLGDRLGGHMVAGHIDGTGKIVKTAPGRFSVRIPPSLEDYLFPTSSIAVDGVSLTVQEARQCTVDIALIPHTIRETTLGEKKIGSMVNIEVDIISKQVVSLLKKYKRRGMK